MAATSAPASVPVPIQVQCSNIVTRLVTSDYATKAFHDKNSLNLNTELVFIIFCFLRCFVGVVGFGYFPLCPISVFWLWFYVTSQWLRREIVLTNATLHGVCFFGVVVAGACLPSSFLSHVRSSATHVFGCYCLIVLTLEYLYLLYSQRGHGESEYKIPW